MNQRKFRYIEYWPTTWQIFCEELAVLCGRPRCQSGPRFKRVYEGEPGYDGAIEYLPQPWDKPWKPLP